MKKLNLLPVIGMALLSVLTPLSLHADGLIHHDLTVTLHPVEHRLSVKDTVTLPGDFSGDLSFNLHAGLKPASRTPGLRIVKLAGKRGTVPLERYRADLPHGLRTFTFEYGGVIHHPLEQYGSEQARGMQETPGIISENGVVLSASSSWYPDFGSDLFVFTLEARLPSAWDAVSQGERTLHDRRGDATVVRWSSPEPQDGIFIIAAPFTEYARPLGRAEAMVFLRAPDQGLADKYLKATADYLEMYSALIGPYPYKKFALVENFWETGYGMPSFTLLGSTVIRLPFIVNTSYPHEILHNWWGNSVFPDYKKGNWSEGLTAYLADHLMKEQQGAGAEYRVDTLQKYADYALAGRDFPLTRFRSRHSSSSEAVGYGKSLMLFHMLRLGLGDEAFTLGLRDFYKRNIFRFAGFDELERSFETISGKDLGADFSQWVARTGAPSLRLRDYTVAPEQGGYVLTALLEQTQPGEAYHLRVPAAVTLEGKDRAYQTVLEMKNKRLALKLHLDARPLRLDIDPEFDLFRRLDRGEIPPAISQALGAQKMLILLPSAADEELLAAYRGLAASLSRSGPDESEVKLDSEVKELPADGALAVMGWENRFQADIAPAWTEYGLALTERSVLVNKTGIAKRDHSFVFASRLPKSRDHAALFIASDLPAALAGLGRKLPHYHKYGYLAFEGPEPANVSKGRWPVNDSPLTVFIPDAKGDVRKVEMGKLAARQPLAVPAPVFSRERMIETVRVLSGPESEGRGFGSEGLDKAAAFIAEKFSEAGLSPAGNNAGSWFQTWEDRGGDPERMAVMKNVIGVIRGTKPALARESVVIGAHYDHLGFGWPESRDNGKGKIHPGADDNASGIAVLIELARVLAQGPKPDRTIVFAAFTGEESGRRGSKRYVADEKRWPVDRCIGMLNLDTVGRLGKQKLLLLGAGSAKEWPHIFRGAGFVTGVEIETVSGDLDSSDQNSFHEAGVPAVQLFSGPHLDYHRTTDRADKIDPDGLVKAASVAKEAIEYLAGREGPLEAARSSNAGASPKVHVERKATLGAIPDFTYHGAGVRISGVVPGSPAETSGLKEGDVITALNATPINNLRDLSNALKAMKPGDSASISFFRNGREMTVKSMVREK